MSNLLAKLLDNLNNILITQPYTYLKTQLNPSFSTIVTLELLLGGLILFKAFGFARYTAEKYRL